jgi:hypothetical protein
MKNKILGFVSGLCALLVAAPYAFADYLPTADLSVWNSAQMAPVHTFANLAIGMIFGAAVLYAVVMIAYYGIKLQGAGGDLIKSQEAKSGLKSTVTGIIITFSAIFVIGIILYVLGIVGIKAS